MIEVATTFAALAVCLLALAPLARDWPPWRPAGRPARGGAPPVSRMSPLQFEHYCADAMRAQGWSARVTPPSGDYGVDVVADSGPVRLVLQAKKWRHPVSLGAVQEVVAGRAHYGATHAAVVSVSGYMQTAVALARTNGVLLLDASSIHRVGSVIAPASSPRRA